MKKRFLLSFFALCTLFTMAQKGIPKVDVLTSGTKTSLRGLSVVSDNVVWVSGSKGTVGRSSNGGKDWTWMTVKGFEDRDFRDIEAFDATTAIIMAVSEPAYILKTIDAGKTWKVVYANKTKGMFLDAMEFWNINAGIVIGDPVNGKIFIARTFDGGETWREIPEAYKPVADSGEACFAASGTNIRALDNDEAVFITGGRTSRIFIRDTKNPLPIIQGRETTGANSIAVWNRYKRNGGNNLVVVGGDFSDSLAGPLCIYSTNRGQTWKQPKTPPRSYKSCVEYLGENYLVACGPTGVDYSLDGAENWQNISSEGFHVARIARNGKTVYLAGGNGKIGKLVFENGKVRKK
jgi:photosystem II stability/assembly factor-like uncharacterized protein